MASSTSPNLSKVISSAGMKHRGCKIPNKMEGKSGKVEKVSGKIHGDNVLIYGVQQNINPAS
jgi:hypothetical protein